MGGHQCIPKTLQQDMQRNTQRYKRFCPICHRVTLDFDCCGTKTRRFTMQTTIGAKLSNECLSAKKFKEGSGEHKK